MGSSKRPVLSFAKSVETSKQTETQLAITRTLEERAESRLKSLGPPTQKPHHLLGSSPEVKTDQFVEHVSRLRKRSTAKGPVIDYSKDLSSEDEKNDHNEVHDDRSI